MSEPKPCPECGSETVPILYGLPGHQAMEAARAGRVILGGCEPHDVAHACRSCGVRDLDRPAEIDRFSGHHSFLSNFHPSAVTLDGDTYPTVEHAFQAGKTDDPAARERIRDAKTPAWAKALGRKVQLRGDWEDVKVGVMTDLVRQKFTAHPDLAAKLLATHDAQLVEGNTWGDRFWGVSRGTGRNELGRILMKVRAEIFAEREAAIE